MFVCLPVGTGRVVSVSKLVHVQKYMLYKYYFIGYSFPFNIQLSIVLCLYCIVATSEQ